jgi:hypothetical protein
MRPRLTGLVLALPLLWGAAVKAQDIKNPAAVLPEGTLAYVELRQPGQIAKELAGLLKGSVLGDVPDSFAPFLAKAAAGSRGPRPSDIAPSGIMASPEFVNEIGRIHGAAVAITGIDKENHNQPEFIAFLMPGDSNIPGAAFRGFLASFGHSYYTSSDGKTQTEYRQDLSVVGEVDGVRIYQPMDRRTTYKLGPNYQRGEATGEPTIRPQGPALARLPSGTILVGTPERIKDVIRRANNGDREGSLAGVKAFQQASKTVGDRPGLFVFGNPTQAFALAEKEIPPAVRASVVAVKRILNPAAIAGVAGSLTLDEGALRFRWLGELNAAEKTPVADILPSKPINADLWNFVPKDALFVAALSNADGEARWKRLIETADQVAKAVAPNFPPPSAAVGGVEGMLKLKIGKDLIGKIEAIAVAAPGAKRLQDEKNFQDAPPMLAIVRTSDDEAATRFAKEVIPQIVGMATFQYGVQPTQKEVDGQTLYGFSKFGDKFCYGRQGATLVFGVKPALVAESLAAGNKKEGYSSAAVKRAGEPVLLMLVKPMTLACAVHAFRNTTVTNVVDDKGKVIRRTVTNTPDPIEGKILALSAEEEPLTVSLTRRPEGLMWEASYSNLKRLVPKLVDAAVEAAFQPPAAASIPRPTTTPTPPGR